MLIPMTETEKPLSEMTDEEAIEFIKSLAGRRRLAAEERRASGQPRLTKITKTKKGKEDDDWIDAMGLTDE